MLSPVVIDGLHGDEQQKVTALLVKEFRIESSGCNKTDYLPSTGTHGSDIEVVKSRSVWKELKGVCWLENGRQKQFVGCQSTLKGLEKVRQNAGVDGVVEAARSSTT